MGTPYRDPVALPALDEDEPVTWRQPSKRVLRALAALTEARGASHAAETLAGRARSLAPESPRRTLARCTAGIDAFEHDPCSARSPLTTWLEDAAVIPSSPLDRFEVHAVMATLETMQGRLVEADAHFAAAFSIGATAWPGAPESVAIAVARTLVAFDCPELAAPFVDGREASGALLHLASEIALSRDELAHAQILAGEALELHERDHGSPSAEVAKTNTLIARILFRDDRVRDAERILEGAIETFENAPRRDWIAEGEAWGWVARAMGAKKDARRARQALDIASSRASRAADEPCSGMLPLLRTGVLVFRAIGQPASASAWDGALRPLQAWGPASR